MNNANSTSATTSQNFLIYVLIVSLLKNQLMPE